ncbi:MAG: trypsin-like peptidase domain-containing protein [Planctomycetota bacterium]
MTRIRSYGPSLVLLATAVTVLLYGPVAVRQLAHAQTAAEVQLARNELNASPMLAELNEAFTQVADVVEPSVVHITVSRRAPIANTRGPAGDQMERFREFFEGMPGFRDGAPTPAPEAQPSQPNGQDYREYDPARPFGNGSGWVYDSDGHIITNHHVVAGADEIEVKFADGTAREATVVETDPATDIAVLKVEMDSATLHPAVLAASPVRQGEIVFAFGSPLRFDFSMSQGIVSATGRNLNIISGGAGYERFIQTDAAINRGNSGGPLTNIRGEVVGMNTAIAAGGGGLGSTPGFIGLGFAIPTQMVQRIADQLISEGRVARGFLGVNIATLTPELAETYGYTGQGVLITDTMNNGPAADAGLESGDIIATVNGQSVASMDDLRFLVAGIPPLTDVTVGIVRDGEARDVVVTLGEFPESIASADQQPGAVPDASPADDSGMELLRKYGMSRLRAFTAEDIENYDADFNSGVMVRSVRTGSVAALNGITQGSVITEVMGKSVASVDDLAQAVAEHDADKPIRFTIEQWLGQGRDFNTRILALQLPDND